MPLGFQRLNERSQRPNSLINLIKPLKTRSLEDQKIAQDFLERIAAQCYPVMKIDHIVVMSLEEHEANSEFLGRNFNAGEAIQLVLKDKAGRWLSFRFVQMVMMHELAHCKQMNHSKYFWQVRNRYAQHMEELWAKNYSGEGVWGRGQNLTTGAFLHDRMPEGTDVPPHLCGGTYRRHGKRKRGEKDTANPNSTYAERQQKRIAKKFGKHGEGHDLGEDELVRGALEQGKRRPGKPRVANSKRGRDLRANAALARFEAEKQDKQRQSVETTPELIDSETESENDSDDPNADVEALGKITDQREWDLYQVCGDEGEDNEGRQEELAELRRLGLRLFGPLSGSSDDGTNNINGKQLEAESKEDSETESESDLTIPKRGPSERQSSRAVEQDSEIESEPEAVEPVPKHKSTFQNATQESERTAIGAVPDNIEPVASSIQSRPPKTFESSWTLPVPVVTASNSTVCSVCTMENDKESPTCAACANVIRPSLMADHWRCKSDACRDTSYVNAGDAGRCGLCGGAKPVVAEKKPMGVLSADILRWD